MGNIQCIKKSICGEKLDSCSTKFNKVETNLINVLYDYKHKILTKPQYSGESDQEIISYFFDQLITIVSQNDQIPFHNQSNRAITENNSKAFLKNTYPSADTKESEINIVDYYNKLYTEIREDLENNDFLFTPLIEKFFRMLERVLQISQMSNRERSEKSSTAVGMSIQEISMVQSIETNSRCRRLSKTKLDQNILAMILELQDNKIDFYIYIFLAMFQLLQVYLKFVYSPVFKIQKIDQQLDQELFILRIVEYYILMKESIGNNLLTIIIKQKYQYEIQEQSQNKVLLLSQEIDLKDELKPKSVRSLDTSYVLREQIKWKSQQMYQRAEKLSRSNQEMNLVSENNNKIYQQVLESFDRSTSQFNQLKIPYSSTFPLLSEMLEEQKFWRIFRLIEVFDQRIKDLYLNDRSTFEQAFEKIEAEDNKNEILLFILFKYNEENQADQQLLNLYLKIKFMYDHDEIISYKIKAYLSQSFIRFYGILELIINMKKN